MKVGPLVEPGPFNCTQLAVIEAYLERFPRDEREFRALAWVEANAGAYRQHWQTRVASRRGYVQFTSR